MRKSCVVQNKKIFTEILEPQITYYWPIIIAHIDAMFYAVFVPPTNERNEDGDGDEDLRPENLIFTDIKEACKALKKYRGSRMKTFSSHDQALDFVSKPDHREESFLDESSQDLAATLEKLSLQPDAMREEEQFSSPAPAQLSQLRKLIEKGDYEEVEKMIWSNPRYLVTVCDSAVYLMAGPKYNACHIAARANKPDIMALILDTVSNNSFMRKLYTKESDQNVQDRVNHLLDSYLNTPDPRQGNTPLHFACKLGHYRVVRVLLTFEGCDLNLKDVNGKTAEESICVQAGDDQRLRDMFKSQLHSPAQRDQLKKRLQLAKRRRSLIQ